jgi:hypothetical protein
MTPLDLALLVSTFAQDHPLQPPYPFKSCKITFKHFKSGGLEADLVVYIKGPKSVGVFRQTRSGRVDETVTRGTDGIWIFEVTADGSGAVKEAKRERHPAYFLRADLAELEDGEKKKLAENLPRLWRKLAPAFNVVEWDVRAEYAVGASEKVAGRDCETFEYKGGGPRRKLWRWQGTDLILKQTTGNIEFEAEKVEENIDLPDSVFGVKADQWEEDGRGFDRQHAVEIFKELVGREPQADPDRQPGQSGDPGQPPPALGARVTIDGKEYKIEDISIEVRDDGALVLSSSGDPGMTVQANKAGLKRLPDAVGKEYRLKDAENRDEGDWMEFRIKEGLEYVSKAVTIKVESYKDGVAQVSVSGVFHEPNANKEIAVEFKFKARHYE